MSDGGYLETLEDEVVSYRRKAALVGVQDTCSMGRQAGQHAVND
jgi:hypothetical protein